MAKSNSEKTKRIILISLGGALAALVVYQFFFRSPDQRPRRVNSNSNSAVAVTTQSSPGLRQPVIKRGNTAAEQQAQLQTLLDDRTPLDLNSIKSGGSSEIGSRGSIFAYYVKPPEPVKSAPPPPIALQGLQPQSAIAGTPRKFTMNVFASPLPEDATIYFNGHPKPTKRVSDRQLSTEVEPAEYSAQVSINIDVKSKAEPEKFHSGALTFVAQALPDPPFRYIARLGNMSQPEANYGVLEMNASREIKRVRKGETVAGGWRIDSINTDSIDVTHTQYEIRKRVPLQEKAIR